MRMIRVYNVFLFILMFLSRKLFYYLFYYLEQIYKKGRVINSNNQINNEEK